MRASLPWVLFWGDATPHIRAGQRAGVRVVPQVASIDEAKAAADAGADAVMIQGVEAGGHVRGTTARPVSSMSCYGLVVPAPVCGRRRSRQRAGRRCGAAVRCAGRVDGDGVRLALTKPRSPTAYKQRVVRARAEDTVHTLLFDVGWPDAAHRVLRNANHRGVGGGRTSAERAAAGRGDDRGPLLRRGEPDRRSKVRRRPADGRASRATSNRPPCTAASRARW